MESCQSKQCELVAVKTLQEKVQDLPLLCVEAICKLTRACDLFRLYSQVVPLPGAVWNDAVEAAIKKRLPLSLDIDRDCPSGLDLAVYDVTGAKLATVKHPEALRFSPLLECIESASLDGFTPYPEDTNAGQLYVHHGAAILSHLPKITALTLFVRVSDAPGDARDLIASNMKHLLPQLESLVIQRASRRYKAVADQAMRNFLCAVPTNEMSRLRCFRLPFDTFRYVLEQSNSGNGSVWSAVSGLSSLAIWQFNCWTGDVPSVDLLRYVSTCYRQLTALYIFVTGEFKAYLDAFRALTNLNTLGMHLHLGYIKLNGLTFDGSKPITSVSDLRIISGQASYEQSVFKIATFFPNVRAVAIRVDNIPDLMQLAATLFDARQVLPAVAKLGCFYFAFSDDRPTAGFSLTQFVANPRLPETVDLSQLVCDPLLAHDAGVLTAIFCSMQANSIKSLLLRGPLHCEALSRLRSYVDLKGGNAKATAWTDRDLDAQPGILYLPQISEHTDFKILGTKTSGCLKGEKFTIRVLHQLAKRMDIFN